MIDINNIRHIKKVIRLEIDNNLKTKDQSYIEQIKFSELCFLAGYIDNFIKVLENPEEYIRIKKMIYKE